MNFSKRMLEIMAVIVMAFLVIVFAIAVFVEASRVVAILILIVCGSFTIPFLFEGDTSPSAYSRFLDDGPEVERPVIDDAALRAQVSQINGRTNGGHVYVIRDSDVTGYCKIGRSHNLRQRLDTFDTHLPFNVEVVTVIPCRDCVQAETILHRRFADKRRRGEWFELTDADIAWLQQWDKA
jgi:hypothetical protein